MGALCIEKDFVCFRLGNMLARRSGSNVGWFLSGDLPTSVRFCKSVMMMA